MGKIVAIGGGNIRRESGHSVDTIKIDKELIKLTGKKKPKLLFIPTASSDSVSYFEIVKKYFGKKLGCKVEVLYLIKEKPSKKEIENKILTSNIIYVGGGNTLKMMNVWRKLGVDKSFKKAYEKEIILSGISAGSICWFKYGNSDSRKYKNLKVTFNHIKVSGLGLINALNCPHYDFEKERKLSLKKIMKRTSGVAIAIENCCALEIIDNKYRIISSKKSANAYKTYWQNGKYYEEKIKKENKFKSLKELLEKNPIR